METADRKTVADGVDTARHDDRGNAELARLRDVARLGRLWLETMPLASAQRTAVMHMNFIVDEMANKGDDSPDAMVAVRAMLCLNCRRLGAAQGNCSGASLRRCTLLNALKQ